VTANQIGEEREKWSQSREKSFN